MKLKSLIVGGLWTSYGAITAKILTLLSSLFLARLLLPSDFGTISIAYIFWGLANLFSTAGSFIVYKGTEDKRYLNTTYTISICIGLFLSIGLLVISPLVASFFNSPNLVWILAISSINLLFSFAQSVYAGVLTRRLQYQALANINLVTALTRLIFTVSFALLGFGYWSFVIGDTVFWITNCALSRHCAKHNFRLQIDTEVQSEILSYYLGAAGFTFGFYVNSNCDNFVIGKLLGSTSLGYYNFAYQITMALTNMLGQILDQIGTPAFAQLQDDKMQKNALLNSVEQVAFLAAPIYALFFLLVDRQAIVWIFGAKWLPAYAVIPWLLVFGYFRLVNGLLSSMLFAKGKPGVNAKINLHIAPIAVLGFLLGAWQGGILGVSIAVAIILGIVWTMYWWWIGCQELKWPLNKFIILILQPALIALVAIFISLETSAISTPIVFVSITLKTLVFIFGYLIITRLVAKKIFFQYRLLMYSFINKIVEYRKIS